MKLHMLQGSVWLQRLGFSLRQEGFVMERNDALAARSVWKTQVLSLAVEPFSLRPLLEKLQSSFSNEGFYGCGVPPSPKATLGEEGLIWLTLPHFSPGLKRFRTETQRAGTWRTEQRPGKGAVYWLVLRDLLNPFSNRIQSHKARNGPTHNEMRPPQPITNE